MLGHDAEALALNEDVLKTLLPLLGFLIIAVETIKLNWDASAREAAALEAAQEIKKGLRLQALVARCWPRPATLRHAVAGRPRPSA